MFEYEIGFYHKPASTYENGTHWLITYDGRHFSVKNVDGKLIPQSIRKRRNSDKKLLPYPLCEPVLIRKEDPYNEESKVNEVVFLRDVPIRMDEELTNQGYEIYARFLKPLKSSNPCLKDKLSMSDFTGRLSIKTTVFFNGLEATPQIPTYPKDSATRFMNQLLLTHIVLSSIVIGKICEECTDCYQYSYFRHFIKDDSYSDRPTHDTIVARLKEYVDEIKISDIVDNISCSIDYAYRPLGRDNEEMYYKRSIGVSDSYSFVHYDEYLSELLPLGCRSISGDVRCVDVPHYQTGPVKGEELNAIKKRILNSYSKEEHLGYLLAEWHAIAFHQYLCKPMWDQYFEIIVYALKSYFNIDEITNKFINCYRNEDEKVYFIANRDRDTSVINKGLKESTLCNLDPVLFEQFVQDLTDNVGIAQNKICDYYSRVWHEDDNMYYNYNRQTKRLWQINQPKD